MPSIPLKKLIIIGAPKSGTTSLARWLSQHPALCLGANKEPNFFTDFAPRNWSGPKADTFAASFIKAPEDYEANFTNEVSAEWGIDASTDYLSCETSPALIETYARNIDVKLVCVLRDPVERAFSEYAHTIRDGYQFKSFRESLVLEQSRIDDGWIPLFHHIRRSRYADALQRYQKHFGPDRLLILSFEDVREGAALPAIETFLGVKPHAFDISEAANVSHAPRSSALRQWIHGGSFLKRMAKAASPEPVKRWIKQLNTTRLEVTPDEAAAAYALLREDIARTQALVPFDTGHWTRS